MKEFFKRRMIQIVSIKSPKFELKLEISNYLLVVISIIFILLLFVKYFIL